MKERCQKFLKQWGGKIPLPAVLVMAVGCLLLLLPTGQPASVLEEAVMPERTEFDLEAFEQHLSQVLSRVSGAGETRVLLSLESSSRKILAQDRKQDGDSNVLEPVIVEGDDGGEDVVSVQTVAPVFRGAVVVCPGAGDAAVRLALTQAVSVLTGLGTDRICVCTGEP